MRNNVQLLNAALLLALADSEFMGNNSKVDKAVDALTPKDGLTRIFKQLQGNAKKDFLLGKDEKKSGYTDENKAAKIREYVEHKFNSYMLDSKTSDRAKALFNEVFNPQIVIVDVVETGELEVAA